MICGPNPTHDVPSAVSTNDYVQLRCHFKGYVPFSQQIGRDNEELYSQLVFTRYIFLSNSSVAQHTINYDPVLKIHQPQLLLNENWREQHL